MYELPYFSGKFFDAGLEIIIDSMVSNINKMGQKKTLDIINNMGVSNEVKKNYKHFFFLAVQKLEGIPI